MSCAETRIEYSIVNEKGRNEKEAVSFSFLAPLFLCRKNHPRWRHDRQRLNPGESSSRKREDAMRKIRARWLYVWLIYFGVWTFVASQDSDSYLKISGKEIFSQAKYLSSEKFKGRETFSDEQLEAGRYIAGKFRDYGLGPADPKAGFYQTIEMEYGFVGRSNRLSIDGIRFREGTDFRAAAVGTNTVAGQIAFVGYGISTKDFDSYASLDVRDKIVMVFEGKLNKSGKEYGIAPLHGVLVVNAINHGAAGMIFVEGTSPKNRKMPIPSKFAADSMRSYLEMAQKMGLIRLGPETGFAWRNFPLVYITAEVADILLKKSNQTIADLKNTIDETGQPLSFLLDQQVKIQTNVSHGLKKTANIIGLIEGRDPVLKKAAVVIGAHYDHIGLIQALDAPDKELIAFGADDNASGTAALMEIVRIFAGSRVKPRRSILFIAFTGEETGALGSQFYSEHPLIPLSQTMAMLNLDMIGRDDPKTIKIFCSRPDFLDLSRDLSREVKILPERLSEGYAESSDHANFLAKKIPVIFYYDGGGNFAHSPADTWDQLSPEKMEAVARLCFLTACQIANQDESRRDK
jgi:aminopeptidase YwaD